MAKYEASNTDLTKNQSLVMGALSQANGPLSAYTILDELREHGFRAPLQVYRALEKLVEFGLVHRLESLNAFVACQHTSCGGDRKENVFAICEKCGGVQELANDRLLDVVKNLASDIEFRLSESVIELRGLCASCKAD
jgi:Fur family zinc uptake transcriptional regulator